MRSVLLTPNALVNRRQFTKPREDSEGDLDVEAAIRSTSLLAHFDGGTSTFSVRHSYEAFRKCDHPALDKWGAS